MAWLPFEQRWRDTLCAAILPALPDGSHGGYPAVETEIFWARLFRVAPPLVRLALRASVWVLTLTAPFMALFRLRLFTSLPPADRDRVLCSAASSRLWTVRQMLFLLKLFTCFAVFGDPSARSRFGASP